MKYILLTFVLLFLWGFFIEPNLIVIKRYKVDFLKGQKIVFISDLHIAKLDKARLKRIVSRINSINPALVLCGGDYIKGHTGKGTLPIEEQAEILSEIKSEVVSVLGNHDGWYDKFTVQKALEKYGIKVLNNTSIKINDLYIAGVEDLQTGFPDSKTALENTAHPRILLTHSPDVYYDVKSDVDLILAGHVHGGQVRIPFLGALICPSAYGTKFCGGSYKETNNRMIVSRGLGTSILNVRFCDIPEIIVLE